jgi:hypothetical protein
MGRSSKPFEIQLDAWPCVSAGELCLDVPVAPHGSLKKILREFLREFPSVASAYLLAVSGPAVGETETLTVALASTEEIDDLFARWRTRPSPRPRLAFVRMEDDALAHFAFHYASPFYLRDAAPLPAPYADVDWSAWLDSLPERPHLEATVQHLAALVERPDEEDRRVARELVESLRDGSTHTAARRFLRESLHAARPFSLLLRTFGAETFRGPSTLTGGQEVKIMRDRRFERMLPRITPLPLVAIANPLDPFPSSDVLQLEAGAGWLRAVVSLVARATAIFVVCDRLDPGIAQEFDVIQQLEREDDTFIVLPDEDVSDHYRSLQALTTSQREPLDPRVLRRKLVTFGVTGTTAELSRMASGQAPDPS